jgi:uncharacterized protein YgiM (DUF1202 family)
LGVGLGVSGGVGLFWTLVASLGVILCLTAAPSAAKGFPPAGRRFGRNSAAEKVRLVVQDFLVQPRRAGHGAARRYRRYRRYYRQTKKLHLRATPNGAKLCRVQKGVKVRVLKQEKQYSKVLLVGAAEVEGYLPNKTLGYRILRKTAILGSPAAKDKIGEAQGGVYVRVERSRGRYTQVVLMGPCPIKVWIKSKDLGVENAKVAKMGSYPRGRRMVLKKGKLYAKPKGRVIGTAVGAARIYRVETKNKWVKVNLANYRYYHVEAWVPKDRVQYGYFGYWRGNGYGRTSSNHMRGDMVAVVRIPLYMEKDDAYPTAYLTPGARFRVSNLNARWSQIHFYGSISFTAYARKAPGLWVPRAYYSKVRLPR